MKKAKINRLIHGQAPLRINDIGGWTDTWFARQGRVQNLAIGPPVEVQIKGWSLAKEKRKRVRIIAENYKQSFSFDPDNPSSGPHPLLQQAVNLVGVPADLELEISLFSPVPPGMSTGTSASVCVALIGSLLYLQNKSVDPNELASLAHQVETQRLKQQCGIQDQLCATFGGPLFIEINQYPKNQVTKLAIKPELWAELERRLVLIYLGKPHLSTSLHETIIRRLETGEASFRPLIKMAALAERAKVALERGDLTAYGQIMIENNEWQRQLGAELISRQADQVISLAKKFKASGWKVNGAGGEGGSLTILASPDDCWRRKMIEAIGNLGGGIRFLPLYLTSEGFKVWESH
ncbi:MAG: GHMP kinase [Candidatus Aminicenantes bacterium]|nr:GHMP kinase [Candidatus Aminicenantes bacterium]